ncbi:MAG: menaquinone biosynthesis decarboxylase [Helicobacteraceae bacterium]|jgi:4-hydroxy-3-polyprenylbenzoate decarboxylase|nr:menaquinone biosynthesis decarboxylase [Helicobacteraceae bacterium]
MREFIKRLAAADELRVIDEEVDVYLEMAHIAYAEVKKKDGGRALLFTKPKRGGYIFQTPVLMNIYGSRKRVEMIFGCEIEQIASRVQKLAAPDHPVTMRGKIAKALELFKLRKCFPKRLNGRGQSQARILLDKEAKLSALPILTTWKEDGGAFITMGQVYTRSLDGKARNLGMYRLQVFDDHTLGLHWQIHKDSNMFFREYEKAGVPMPVSIAIGGDPLYTWCATAPLPRGIFELMLYGFIRDKPAKLVKCLTNDLFVPADADFTIEGFIDDPSQRRIEGPFGDHTGYYTLPEAYPFMRVCAITSKRDPVFAATVVGKPPIEDKYMGYPTERIFLPLFRTSCPELIDYRMPENGVFHNLIIAKLRVCYDAHALQAAHAFWGAGQMSFVKHAVFVGEDAPDLNDYAALLKYCLDRFSPDRMLISSGVLDALDHSSPKPLAGGKLGLDFTGEKAQKKIVTLGDLELLDKIKSALPEAIALKQYGIDSANPIALIQIRKSRPVKTFAAALEKLKSHISIAIILDEKNNDVNNAYMSLWRVCNNIDVARDLIAADDFILLDATTKDERDGFYREWPKDVDCDRAVIEKLREKGLWEFDETFIKKWQAL